MEDKRNKRAKTAVTVETVRERERERELYSKELGFISVAKKLVKVNKGGLCASIGI
jgi:hypothetical protein